MIRGAGEVILFTGPAHMPNRVDPIAFPPDLDTSFQGVAGRLLDGLLTRGVVSDDSPGGVARTLVETFARELATFYEILSRAHAAGYLETADGEALDQVVALLGLTRGAAGRLTGEVVLSRSTAALAAIAIPAGLRLTGRTATGKALPVLEVVEDAEIARGARSVAVAVQEVPDQDTAAFPSLPAHSLTVMPRPLLGVERVDNPDPITRAGVEEDDEALRARARVALRVGERSTAEALIAAAREAGADHVTLSEPEDGPAGRLIVRVADPGLEADPDKVERVRAALTRAKAAGVRVEIELVRTVLFAPALELVLEDPDLPAADRDLVRARVAGAVATYVNALPPETGINRRKVEGAALSVSGVSEVRLLPATTTRPLAADGAPGEPDGDARRLPDGSGWVVRSGERAAIDADRQPIVVQVRADRVLTVSLFATVRPNPLSADGWRNAIRAALSEAFAALPAAEDGRVWTLAALTRSLAERAFVAEIRELSIEDSLAGTARFSLGDASPIPLPSGARLAFGALNGVVVEVA